MALTPAQRAFQEGGGLYGALSPEMRESYEETGAFGPPGDAPYTSIGAKQIRYDVPWSVADQYGWTDADGNVSESASDPRHRNYFFGDNFINKLATDWFKKGITTGGNEEIVAHIQENYPEMARAMEAGSGYENLNIGRAIATYDNAIRIQGFQQQNKRSFLQTYGPTALAVAAAVTGNPFLIGTQGALAASEGDLEGVFRSALTLGTGGGGYTDTSSTVGDLVDAYNITKATTDLANAGDEPAYETPQAESEPEAEVLVPDYTDARVGTPDPLPDSDTAPTEDYSDMAGKLALWHDLYRQTAGGGVPDQATTDIPTTDIPDTSTEQGDVDIPGGTAVGRTGPPETQGGEPNLDWVLPALGAALGTQSGTSGPAVEAPGIPDQGTVALPETPPQIPDSEPMPNELALAAILLPGLFSGGLGAGTGDGTGLGTEEGMGPQDLNLNLQDIPPIAGDAPLIPGYFGQPYEHEIAPLFVQEMPRRASYDMGMNPFWENPLLRSLYS